MAICTVTGTICKADETPLANQLVKATIKSTQQDQGGQVAGTKGVVSDPIEAFSEDDGSFGIDLIQGATVLLEIPTINLRKEILVPAQVTVDFTTLI
jgi:hypothetical protein